jgi:hypothetical protein
MAKRNVFAEYIDSGAWQPSCIIASQIARDIVDNKIATSHDIVLMLHYMRRQAHAGEVSQATMMRLESHLMSEDFIKAAADIDNCKRSDMAIFVVEALYSIYFMEYTA